jgi:hypothetical protein
MQAEQATASKRPMVFFLLRSVDYLKNWFQSSLSLMRLDARGWFIEH